MIKGELGNRGGRKKRGEQGDSGGRKKRGELGGSGGKQGRKGAARESTTARK